MLERIWSLKFWRLVINTQNDVILVDADDREIGQMAKMQVHELALLHRAFSVMLYRQHQGQWQFLLQKRQEQKYHCGGFWSNTCCSHPRPGEDTLVAAERRLFEELGIRVLLKEIGAFTYQANFENGLTEHEFDHVFIAEYDALPKNFNRDEISELKWVDAPDLLHSLAFQAAGFTPWLAQVVGYCLHYLSDVH